MAILIPIRSREPTRRAWLRLVKESSQHAHAAQMSEPRTPSTTRHEAKEKGPRN
jgi:hypothetical protein